MQAQKAVKMKLEIKEFILKDGMKGILTADEEEIDGE